MPEVSVAAMLRAGGAVLMVATALSFLRDLALSRGAPLHSLTAEAIAFALGLVCCACSSWLSLRPWRWFLFASYSLLVLNYALATLESHNLIIFCATLALVEVGAAALTPWEDFWQLALNLLCILAWIVTAHLVAHPGLDVADMSVSLLAAAAIAQFTVRTRRRFTADNLAARYKFRDSEARLRKILNASPDTVSIIRERDRALCEVLGRKPDRFAAEMIGRQLFAAPSPRPDTNLADGNAAEIFSDLRETNLTEDKIARDLELEYQAADGEQLHALVSAARIENDGEWYIVAFAREITQLKRAQTRMIESEHRFRSAFAAVQKWVGFYLSIDGRFVDYEGPTNLSGFTHDEIVGRTPAELNLWVSAKERNEAALRMKRDGQILNMEVQSRCKDGSIIPILLSTTPLEINGKSGFITAVLDLSEVRETQSRLAASQATLGKVFNASTDSMIVSDVNTGLVIEINSEFSRLTGYSRDEAVGRDIRDLRLWNDPAKSAEFARSLHATNEVRNIEDLVRTKSGALVPCLMSGALFDFGALKCCLATTRDVTELKRVQRRLEQSEHRARTILAAMPGATAIIDSKGKFVEVSKPMAALGFTGDDLIGRGQDEVGFWADPAEKAEFDRVWQRDGSVIGMELHLRCKDGASLPTLLSVAPLEVNGEPGAIMMALDITALEQAQRNAVESQTTLGTIFEASRDGMAVTDLATDIIVAINTAFVRATGHTRDELIGHSLTEFRMTDDDQQTAEYLRQLRDTGEVRNLEIRFRRKNGEVIPTLMSIGTIDFNGRPCRLTASRDISALKQTEHDLVEAREAALDASRAKSEFLSSMSHEIRTPLNAVLGMAELLAETALDDEQRRFLDVMNANSIALLELINSILDLARIESGRLQIENIDFELTDLIDKTIATFSIRAHSKGLELAARIAPGTPDYLSGDPHRLRQVLVNLLGNAIKFTEVGEVVLDIEQDPATLRQPAMLRFTVSDTGIGIAPDKLDAIFTSFTQADSSTTRKYGGTGLGLAIAQRLTGLMGGRIWLESELGKGSKFIFTVPFGLASRVIAATSNAMPDLAGFRVLVVDDNPTNRLIARELVSSRGAEVTEATSGEEALAAVRTALEAGRPIQMVLLDMRMPGMDGLEVATRMRVELRASELLILMLSSDDLMPQLSRMKAAGLDAYLVKPISRSGLFDAIARVLAQPDSARGPQAADSARGPQPSKSITSSTANSARGWQPAERITSFAANSALGSQAADGITAFPPDSARGSQPPKSITSSTANSAFAADSVRGSQAADRITPFAADHAQGSQAADSTRVPQPPKSITSSTANSARAWRPADSITSSAADSADLRPSLILVAEDSPDNRLLISAFLRRSPCIIQFAENGRRALELFQQKRYDLVLMDLQMPVMDGYESTRAIREWEQAQHAPHTNIVALTASALSEDADRARVAGCDAHVTKPIKKATLLALIRQFSALETSPAPETTPAKPLP